MWGDYGASMSSPHTQDYHLQGFPWIQYTADASVSTSRLTVMALTRDAGSAACLDSLLLVRCVLTVSLALCMKAGRHQETAYLNDQG